MPKLNAQYTIGGNASSIPNNCYQLTAALNSQAGYVYQNQAIDLNDPFDLTFDVYLGTNNGGADGIVFVLRGTLAAPFIGTGGGAIGYDGPGFSTNSIGIEVDTWQNGNGDLAADHIGIFKNGSVSHIGVNSLAGPIQASAANANVEDGNYHTFNVRWDPVTENLEVYLDCDFRLQYTGDIITDIFNGDNLVHWGFLGTTGGASNVQRFCLTTSIDSLLTPLQDQQICNGDSVQLDAGDPSMTYTWSPAAGLSATNVNDPWASPANTTAYNVEIVHQCDTAFDTAVVTVTQPNFNAFAQVSPALCNDSCDGTVALSVVNGTGSYSFDWNVGDTTANVSDLCAGTYTVTIQDVDPNSPNYLCFLEESYTINEPSALVNNMTNVSKTSCPDGQTCDASATSNVTGGVFPYSYIWSSGEPFQTAQQLCADSNFVTITDANGCVLTDVVVIDIPDSIVTTAFGDTLICISNVAALIGATTGGTPPYGYIWREGSLNGSIISNSQSFSVTPSTTTWYYLESSDANGCVGDTSAVLVKVRPPLNAVLNAKDTICPYDTIPVTVEGFGGDTNYTYSWSNGSFGNTIFVSPNTSEWFVVTVGDFCGTPAYKDSIFVQVGGHPRIRATLKVEDDSICVGESVYLISSAFGGFKGPDEYVYKWEHTQDDNSVQFVQPNRTTTYTTTITDLCLSTPGIASVTVYVDKPSVPQIAAEPFETCAATDVVLSILNFNPKYSYSWRPDDTTFVSAGLADSITWSFSAPGCNSFSIDATTDFGCYASFTAPCIVNVYEPPIAAFQTDVPYLSNTDQVVTYRDVSSNVFSTLWYIQGDTLNGPLTFQRAYRDTLDDLTFTLVAISEEGCIDTLHGAMPFKYLTQIFYPSAFTPNGDGLNDVFKIEGEAISPADFNLVIYDRWGQQVFRANTPDRGWDGRFPNGEPAALGMYTFVMRYRDHTGELRVVRDQVLCHGGKPQGLR